MSSGLAATVLAIGGAVALPAVAGSTSPAPPLPVSSVLAGSTMNSTSIPCATEGGGIRVCHGTAGASATTDQRLKSFDGTPLDIWVTLPAANPAGDGDYPLIVQSHGWGSPPTGPDDGQYGGPTARSWAQRGYAVVQLTARGWGDSCGTAASRAVDPAACAKGYIRLADVRYEIHDVQNTVGLLVDDGLVDPDRVGVTGESYGAGTSLALASMRDRVMEPDGTVHPWTSPDGTPLHIAAAVPVSGWSDLATALMPNGRTLDDRLTESSDDISPIGVWKQSIAAGLYLVGNLSGFYAPAGSDPGADVSTWFTTMGSGGPYDTPEVAAIAEQITRFHSPFSLLTGVDGFPREAPAPLLLAAGFTDAVFPVDESLRYATTVRAWYPDNPISLFFYDGGHTRGQNKPADGTLLQQQIAAFFDHYVAGTAPAPRLGVTALTQTCPKTAPSGGPFQASAWADLHPGTVRYSSTPSRSISSSAGDPVVEKAFEPLFGGLSCTTAPAADQGAGVATDRLPAAVGSGFTLLGSPTITADFTVHGTGAYVVGRLLDVDPATGTETLISRGVYRFDSNAPDGRQTFQLEANGWHFAAGHIPKLELLGRDSPFLLASPTPFTVDVANLTLSLPIHESAAGTASATAATPVAITPRYTG